MDGGADRSDPNALSEEEAIALRLFAKLDTVAFTIATGCVAAVAMFFATAILLMAGPVSGQPIGGHLIAFRTYWPGYSVTWPGAFIGAFYAFWAGSVAGFCLALFWNFSHIVMLGVAAVRRGGLE